MPWHLPTGPRNTQPAEPGPDSPAARYLRGLLSLLLAAAAFGGCTAELDPPPPRSAPPGVEPPPTAPAPPAVAPSSASDPSTCLTGNPPVVDGPSLSVQISRTLFECAPTVVVAEPTPAAAWTGALEAIAVRGPLLVADDPDLVAAELERLRPARVVVVGSPPRDVRFESELVVVPPRAVEPPRAVLGSAGEPLWMVAADPDPQHAAAWAVTWTGHSYVEVEDPGRIPGQWLRLLQAAEPVVPLGFDATDLWWLEAIRAGNQLPGGGVWLFPGRRLVAFYGSPDTPSLGVLGEQGPAETLRRMQPLLEAYTADGSQVLPTFEIIATVASARPTADGDYSAEVDLDTLRPWVDEAARVGAYVVLDLQPGRAPFLEQARRYEELLSMPHVGLALDPEWRLGPGEVHLRRVGSVDAEEVNGVAEWLAGLVRAHRLPQKLLVVHQFKESMIRDRDRLEIPPELALVIQMDGQGPLGSKYATWRNITGGRDPSWWWGWKNFLDEDRPVASPDQVMELDPTPVFVSYQ